jgi:uncharacterized protein (UPF0332 family)/predicted nucleotidyltransferase
MRAATGLLCSAPDGHCEDDPLIDAAEPQAQDRPEADLTERYRARVLAAFPGRVERIVLFGSRVRGNLHEDSDWDFAVHLDHEPDDDEKKRLRGIDLALGGEIDEEVQSFLFGPERWAATDELACNIRAGVIIHGDDQKPMIERPVLQHARDALNKAERFAELSEETPDDRFEGVIHGAYYAMFHAARAALLAVQGTASTKHGRVVAPFARMVERRKLGQEASDLAQTLTDASELRAGADYGPDDLTREGQALHARMRPFLALCGRLVEERAGA